MLVNFRTVAPRHRPVALTNRYVFGQHVYTYYALEAQRLSARQHAAGRTFIGFQYMLVCIDVLAL